MADASIPLAVRSPQIEPPQQILGQMYSFRSMADQHALNQQQQQAAQLENQQRQQAVEAQNAINESMRENISAGQDGTPTFNYEGVAKSLAQRGHGAQVPGILKGALDVQKEQAEAQKTKLANAAAALEQSAQMLQGLKGNPQAAQSYQQILPMLRKTAQQTGIDPATIPANYDPNATDLMIAWGTKAADHARAGEHAADLAAKMTLELPKSVKEATEQVGSEVANARSEGEYQTILQKYRALYGQDRNGILMNVLSAYPAVWSPEVSDRASRNAVPVAEQAKTAEANLNLAAQKGAAAARNGQGPYASFYYGLPAEQRAIYPHPDKYDAKQTPLDVAKVGTPAAQQTSGAATEEWRQQQAGLMEQRIQLLSERLANGTTGDRNRDQKELIQNLANRAIADSQAGGGKSIDDAIANVRNTQFYQNDPMDERRGAVADYLKTLKSRDLKDEQVKASAEKTAASAAASAETAKLFGVQPSQPSGNAGSQPKPSAPPTRPAATPPPAAVQAGKVQIRTGDGQVHDLKDEAAAKQFESLVKQAGGTSSRVTK